MPANRTGAIFLVRPTIQFSVRAAYRVAIIGHVAHRKYRFPEVSPNSQSTNRPLFENTQNALANC